MDRSLQALLDYLLAVGVEGRDLESDAVAPGEHRDRRSADRPGLVDHLVYKVVEGYLDDFVDNYFLVGLDRYLHALRHIRLVLIHRSGFKHWALSSCQTSPCPFEGEWR